MKRNKNLVLAVGLLSLTIAALFMLARPQEARVSSLSGELQAEAAADPATSTVPPPPEFSTPAGKAYLPIQFDVISTATATISPDATATIYIIPTPPPPPEFSTPAGKAYLPIQFDVISTATATISPDATATIYITPTPPPPPEFPTPAAP